MPRIIRDQAIVEDNWQHLDDTCDVPAGPDVTVSLPRWRRDRTALLDRAAGKLGVRIDGATDLQELAPDLPGLALVVLTFTSVRDGRGLSQAHLLRERFGYTRELRAGGEVLRDQMFFMQRAGINAFELGPERDIEEALTGLRDFTVAYQSAIDHGVSLRHRRWT